MTRFWLLPALILLVSPMSSPALAQNPAGCTTIQDGVVEYSPGHYLAGTPLQVGFDPFGYNYQAQMFSGSYANAYLGKDGFPPYDGDDVAYLAANPTAASHWTWPYRHTMLEMKWNDAWLSSADCDHDGQLDRYYGFPSYVGSSAWLTNHMKGADVAPNGKTYRWVYFVKIVAVPADAALSGGVWYTPDGGEIGPSIWGSFAEILQVSNDAGAGEHGVLSKGIRPGFGWY